MCTNKENHTWSSRARFSTFKRQRYFYVTVFPVDGPTPAWRAWWVNPVFENHGQLALFTQFRCCFVFIFAPQLILMSFLAVLGSVFVRKQPIWSLKIRIFTTENGEIQVLDPFWPTFWERLHLQVGGRRVHPWFRIGFCWFSNFPARVESV